MILRFAIRESAVWADVHGRPCLVAGLAARRHHVDAYPEVAIQAPGDFGCFSASANAVEVLTQSG